VKKKSRVEIKLYYYTICENRKKKKKEKESHLKEVGEFLKKKELNIFLLNIVM
jgi:hypothetical protein